MSGNFFGGLNPEKELKRDVELYFASLSESEKRELFNDLDNQNYLGDPFDGIEFLSFLYAKLKNYFAASILENELSIEEIEKSREIYSWMKINI